MPGLVGAAGRVEPTRVEAALRKLAALPGALAERHHDEAGLLLAAVSRPPRGGAPDASCAGNERGLVLLHGALFRESPGPRRLTAADLLPAASAGRLLEELSDCDGSYAVAFLDRAARTLLLVGDRLGAHPICYGQRNGVFAFGPEAKAVLTLAGLEPRISREGLLGFLACGYVLGERTLFEDVHYLQPGTALILDLSSGRHTVRRHWQLCFDVDPRFQHRGVAEEALFDAILRSHRLLLADRPSEHQVLLSGGLDSRSMLGALVRLGAPPARAVCWGLRSDIPWSDADIAGWLARRFRVPFAFLPYDSESFVDNASDWAFVSELSTDNVGWYGEGLGSLRDFYAVGAPVSFLGDELWGNGGRVETEAQVRAGAAMPSRFPPAVSALLRGGVANEARALHDATLNAITARCESDEPADRKDFLYFNGRAQRFIASLGYYKEHATELRRPFLTRAVMGVTTRLPARFRLYKNLYCTALARLMPEVMAIPDNAVSSLPDWSHDLRARPRLRTFFRDLLRFEELEDGPLAGLVDRDALEKARDRFFAAPATPVSRRAPLITLAQRAVTLRSRTLLRGLTLKGLAPLGTPRDRGSPFDALRRIALVALLQRQLGRLASVEVPAVAAATAPALKVVAQ